MERNEWEAEFFDFLYGDGCWLQPDEEIEPFFIDEAYSLYPDSPTEGAKWAYEK